MAEAARVVRPAPHRVRAWRSRFLARGRRGLADEPRAGRPPQLDSEALAFLEAALEADPRAYGLPVTVWSIRDLREVLDQRLGVRVCTATVHRAVQRLGYRYRRPRHDLRHRQDQEAVAAAEEVLAWRRKKPRHPRDLRLVYLDECEVHRHPRLAKAWRRRGCPLRVPAAGEDRKFAVFGALAYATGRLVCRSSSARTAQPASPSSIACWPRSPTARRWWCSTPSATTRVARQALVDGPPRPGPSLWLPADAPELNLIERVGRHLKDKLSCHRWWADLDALEAATTELRSCLRARFHQPDPGGITLVHNFWVSA